MIVDYYFIRKQNLHVKEMYEAHGEYTYSNGINYYAVIALVLAIIPNVPGFLTTIKVIPQDAVWQWVSGLYHYAWFVGFFVAGIIYYLLMQKTNKK